MKKKGNKKMPRHRQEIIDNPIPTSLFFNGVATHLQVFLKNCIPSTHKQQNSCIAHKQRCRDRVINHFLSLSRHLLVPLLFHELTSLHPPSFQRNDFSTCIQIQGDKHYMKARHSSKCTNTRIVSNCYQRGYPSHHDEIRQAYGMRPRAEICLHHVDRSSSR